MLPYEHTSSGEGAIKDMQKVLHAFGCDQFGQMMNFKKKELMVQFVYRDRTVQVIASSAGYAAAWMKHHPCGPRTDKVAHERKAQQIADIAVYSILRDWIKGQITAIETGILSFDGAFLGQILLSDGRTVMDHAIETKLLENKAA